MASPPNKIAVQAGNILIVGDQIKFRNQLRRILSLEGHKVYEAADPDTLSAIVAKEDIEVLLCDHDLMAGQWNIPFGKEPAGLFAYTEIVTAGPSSDNLEEEPAALLALISQALEKVRLRKRIQQLEQWTEQPPDFDNILGESSAIREVLALARKIAPTDAAVLLQGEAGTGKEMFARAIHAAGPRNRNPFITLNCKAFPKEALEKELFGYKAGAFPGALRDKKGSLEEAAKGSLLLNEISEMDIFLQDKLLLALEQNEFTRAGDTRPTQLNIRLFSSTKKDLYKLVQEGKFREDLLHRLNVFTIRLPSLRDRKMDIPLLARRFMKYFAARADEKVLGMSKDFLYHLQRYPWKGNIRELKNVMERAVIMAESDLLAEDCLPFDIRYQPTDDASITSAFDLKNVERLHLQKVLNFTGGNKAEAAKLLNIGLTTLYRKINEPSN
ncbi:MAG TPA: sigma-54 dependent transcriptional regulator [Puia sp.]|jgi:DNA-binding NtrC family response regulator|nr:sigma-54 dependent transcriptional regulator [Puia sp.]